MLPVDEPLVDERGYRHEIKWDGFRCLAYLEGNKVCLCSRGGRSLNARFPQIAADLAQKDLQAVLDGEIVAFNAQGRADFGLLKAGSKAKHMRYAVFDILSWQGKNLCQQPWWQRRDLLEGTVSSSGFILLSPLLPFTLEECLSAAKERGWEGIVSKHEQSPYLPGTRSAWWRKRKILRSLDGVVVGIRMRGSQVRSFALGLYLPAGPLCYVGSVGSGLNQADREFLQQAAALLAVEHPALSNPPKDDGSWIWFRPHLVAEVQFLEITPQLRLRHPVFLRFRMDKNPEECLVEGEVH
ncbi:MAG TPA: RNA ligase family protein [Limnochordia bacterium]|nr:RNA ligase family protein [Limnochordia bacterium]